VYLISDGGVTKPADFCKALCFADMVIAGNIFAGTDEAPGKTVEIDGVIYKHYDGSSTMKNSRIEGVRALVPRKRSAKEVFKRMHEGLQSCCSYQNCSSVIQLQTKAVLQRITNAGAKEGNYHNVILRETT
jgi:GMP reductase